MPVDAFALSTDKLLVGTRDEVYDATISPVERSRASITPNNLPGCTARVVLEFGRF